MTVHVPGSEKQSIGANEHCFDAKSLPLHTQPRLRPTFHTVNSNYCNVFIFPRCIQRREKKNYSLHSLETHAVEFQPFNFAVALQFQCVCHVFGIWEQPIALSNNTNEYSALICQMRRRKPLEIGYFHLLCNLKRFFSLFSCNFFLCSLTVKMCERTRKKHIELKVNVNGTNIQMVIVKCIGCGTEMAWNKIKTTSHDRIVTMMIMIHINLKLEWKHEGESERSRAREKLHRVFHRKRKNFYVKILMDFASFNTTK